MQNGTCLDGDKITFGELAQRWITIYAEKKLVPMTVNRYKQLLTRINQALGNLKLCKIQQLHIINFINNLEEDGVREDDKYTLKDEYMSYIKENKKALYEVVNERTVAKILKGTATNGRAAHKIADFLKIDISVLFSIHNTKGKLSQQTLLHHFKLLNTILNTAVQWNLLLNNPAGRVKAPRVEQKEISCLCDDEIDIMLDLLKTESLKYQTAVYLGVFGGLRIGEVIVLKWSDIDFSTGKLSITKAGQYVTGVDSFEKAPKNDSSKRELKLPEIALYKLKELQREQMVERLALGSQWIDEDNIFTQWNGKRIFYSTISNWFLKWIANTDLTKITFHGLRHTFATRMLEAEVNPKVVQEVLGHADVTLTLNTYSHVVGTTAHEQMAKIDGLFKPESILNKLAEAKKTVDTSQPKKAAKNEQER